MSSVMIIGGKTSTVVGINQTYILEKPFSAWTPGPVLTTGRQDPACGKIRRSADSPFYSIIVTGGYQDTSNVFTTEILDDKGSMWRPGPVPPISFNGASVVEDRNGGIFLIGGGSWTSTTIYYLPHLGPGNNWILMAQQIVQGRRFAVGFFIPNGITNCTNN